MTFFKDLKESWRFVAKEMDKQERFDNMLMQYYEAYGKVPLEYGYRLDWILRNPKTWRKTPRIFSKCVFAAIQYALNKQEARKDKATKAKTFLRNFNDWKAQL